MSKFEYDTVRALDIDAIAAHRDRFVWLCGENDTWGPPALMHELRALCGADRVLLVPKLRHAFVIHGSHEMAAVVAPLVTAALRTQEQ